MKLELLTSVSRKKGSTQVTASLRNGGTEDIHVLHEFMLSRTGGTLMDAQGRELRAHDASASRGQRNFEMGKIKTHLLQPGKSIEVEQFELLSSPRRASAGDLTWDLKEVRSSTLTLVMFYELTPEAAAIALQHGAPAVAVGRWSSNPVLLRMATRR